MKLQLRIDRAEPAAERIRAFELVPLDGAALPDWTPGAHIRVLMDLPGGSTSRAYSLCGEPGERSRYRIAVQREAAGGGGSIHMHDRLAAGDRIVVAAPENAFPLRPGGGRVELIAGGVGVTPILAMAKRLAAEGRPFGLTVLARSRAAIPFEAEMSAAAGAGYRVVAGDDLASSRHAIGEVAARAQATSADLYHCGPRAFADAVEAAAAEAGIAPERLHTERFVNPTQLGPGRPLRIRLVSTGETCVAPAGVSALEALEKAFGLELPYDCRSGFCGACAQRVLEGEPEHRDVCLTAEERAGGAMCLCVSRARTPELVIDV